MPKLTCKDHGRRVIVIYPGEWRETVIHRNGDHTPCNSKLVTIGGKDYTPENIALFGQRA